MKTKVYCFSKKGNTRKLAQALAADVKAVCDQLPPSYPPENEKLVFIGTGMYGGKADKSVVAFCQSLSTSRVKNVAFFATSSKGEANVADLVEIVKAKGIPVVGDTYCVPCPSLFGNKDRPNSDDIEGIKKWAADLMAGIDE